MLRLAVAAIGLSLAVGGTTAAVVGADASTAASGHSAGSPTTQESDQNEEPTVTTTTSLATTTTTTTTASAHGDHHHETDGSGGVADEDGAQEFLTAVETGIARFEDIDVAYAEGYEMNARAATEPGKRKHFSRRAPNPQVLDPTQPEGLVYYIDGDTAILLGALFVERSDDVLDEPGTHWHDHADDTGNENAPNMMHIWTYDGVANPFGITFLDSLPADWQRGDPWPFLAT